MRTTELTLEALGFEHPILVARLAKHNVYDIAALVAEGIEKFARSAPSYADWRGVGLSRGFMCN